MLKILIAEDEEIIRTGLSSTLAENEKDFLVVGAVENGFEAIEFIKSNEVDVVITDVRMPVMTGLELAEYINNHMSGIKVLVLSGYADFGFAQTAIKNNVCQYLLKPVNVDELYGVLYKIKGELDPKKRRDSLEKREEIVMLLLTEGDSAYDLDVKSSAPMRFAVIAVDDLEIYDNFERREIKKCFTRYKRDVFEHKHSEDFSAFIIEDNCVLIIIEGNVSDIKAIFDEVGEYLDNYNDESCTLSCGVSDDFTDIKDVKRMYAQAYDAIKSRVYSGEGTFAVNGDIEPYRSVSGSEYKKYRQLINKIPFMINAGERDVEKIIDDVYSFITEQPFVEPNAAVKLLGGIDEALSEYTKINGIKTTRESKIEIDKFTSAANMVDFLKEYSKNIMQSKFDSELSERAVIKRVKEYAEKHYAERITLKDIEEKFYINRSYFSWLFGKITGETFKEYLTGVRINAAKRLLRDKDLIKVYEVAERVGYSDYRNFSKAFKKQVGITPLKYRESDIDT